MAVFGTNVTRRIGALILGTVIATTGLVAVTAAPAHATRCFPSSSWVLVNQAGSTRIYEAYTFTLISSVPTFNISDSRTAINNLTTPISVTFTSSQSQTFSIAVTQSMQAKLGQWLTATVSTTITLSRTSQIGVSVTAPVAPQTGIRGDYGVYAFLITMQVQTERMFHYTGGGPVPTPPLCSNLGTEVKTINAPTVVEGWQIGPL